MDRLIEVAGGASHLSSPAAYNDGLSLWIFAGSLYQPSGWLRGVAEPFGMGGLDMLSRRLGGRIRQSLLQRYGAPCGYDPHRHVQDDPERLKQLIWSGKIQVFRLPSDYWAAVFDPGHHFFCAPPRFRHSHLELSRTQAIHGRRNALAWELGELVADRGHGAREKGGSSLPALQRLGRVDVEDVDGRLAFSLVLAARPDQTRYADASRQLAKLGLSAPETPEAFEQAAQSGVEVLRKLSADHPSERMLRDFLLADLARRPRTRVKAELGLDVPMVLALMSGGDRSAAASPELYFTERIGPFSGKALLQLVELQQAVQHYNEHKAAAAAELAAALPEPFSPLPAEEAPAEAEDAPEPDDEPNLDPNQQAAARWSCRKRQIAEAKQRAAATPPGPERDRLMAATERFERNNIAEQKALLCKHVYEDGPPPPGWIDVSKDPGKLDEYGLEPDMLESDESDFRARMYLPDPAVFGEDVKPTVAFRGTTKWVDGFGPSEDARNNFLQGIGIKSDYYERAIRIGERLGRRGADVTLAGHSLGGGMTSAAAHASGLPAFTFNAAGLHKKTLHNRRVRMGSSEAAKIRAYFVKDEFLEGFHQPGWKTAATLAGVGALSGGAVGALAGLGGGFLLSKLTADIAGTPHEIPGRGHPFERHRIGQVVWGIGQQIKEDQAVLRDATGVCCS